MIAYQIERHLEYLSSSWLLIVKIEPILSTLVYLKQIKARWGEHIGGLGCTALQIDA